MAVPNQTPYKEYIANGVSKEFSLDFDVLKKDHLVVLINDEDAPVGSWILDAENDSIIFKNAPIANSKIKVRRKTPLARTTDYKNYNSSFNPSSVNNDFDNIWLKLQEMGVLNWMVENNISDLSDYVDSLNDETKSAFLAMIEKQGVSLNQLDIYVNQLYKKLASIAVEKGWLAEFIAYGDRNQHQVNDDILRRNYANFYDIRSFGGVIDRATDNTALIRNTLANLPSYITLYLPAGTNWDYRNIYNYLKDFQTIIDDSGCDKPRNVWQTSSYAWRKTNSATEATSGNTEGIAGDYHPAYFVDTYADEGTGGARASVIYRQKGFGKWQMMLDFTTEKMFAIAQYGSTVYGTKSLTIGHQDGSAGGKFGFNATVSSVAHSYVFGKPMSIPADGEFATSFSRPAEDTGGIQHLWSYGNNLIQRHIISKDGTSARISKNNNRITTTADGEEYGALRLIKSIFISTLLSSNEIGAIITNFEATTGLVVTLPKAKKGFHFEFRVDKNLNLRITPNVADVYIGSVVAKYKQSLIAGSRMKVIAIGDNTWAFEEVGTWTNET